MIKFPAEACADGEDDVNERPTPKDLAWLGELQSGKLLGRGAAQAMPLPMKIRLLELGLVEETPDGLAITPNGRSVLAQATGSQVTVGQVTGKTPV